jgi:hypothetical protein
LAVAVSLLALVVSLVAVMRSGGSPSGATSTPPPSQPVQPLSVTRTIPIDNPFSLDLDQLSKDNTERFILAPSSKAGDVTFTPATDPKVPASFSSTDGAIVSSVPGQSLCLVTNGTPPALACFVVKKAEGNSVDLKITTWRIV